MNLKKILVQDLMKPDVAAIHEKSNIYDAVTKMLDLNIGSLVVVRDESGPLSRDIISGLLPVYFTIKYLLKPDQGKSISIMGEVVDDFIYINLKESIHDALTKIANNRTWRLIVLDDDDSVVGFLSAADIIFFLNTSTKTED